MASANVGPLGCRHKVSLLVGVNHQFLWVSILKNVKASVRLEACLDDITQILKERDEIVDCLRIQRERLPRLVTIRQCEELDLVQRKDCSRCQIPCRLHHACIFSQFLHSGDAGVCCRTPGITSGCPMWQLAKPIDAATGSIAGGIAWDPNGA